MKKRVQFSALFIALEMAITHTTSAQNGSDFGSLTLEELLNVKITTASKLSQTIGHYAGGPL